MSGQYERKLDSATNSATVTNLSAESAYFFAVRACNANRTLCSAYSNEVTLKESGYEPDDDWQTAKEIFPKDRQTRSIHPPMDQDWVKFTLDRPAGILLQTNGYRGGTAMRLYDENLKQLAFDADGGPEMFSRIDWQLGAGKYYARVEEGAAAAPIDPYYLRLLDKGDVKSFGDVPSNYWARKGIDGISAAGITGGCSATQYCPTAHVTRDQMAAFLGRATHGGNFKPPAAVGDKFDDVQKEYWAASWIEQFVEDGITGGCGNGNYCPRNPVTRAQMAIFLLKSWYGPSYSPPKATGATFNDVQSDHWAASWIEQLVKEKITGGCGGGNYCPESPVTRDQMGMFIARAFDLWLDP